jgi:acetyltransferase-like isoleucine patch superfamily enzyme
VKSIRREFKQWYRALLQALPGQIGEALRRRFYGFECHRSSRVLSNVTVYHPEKLTIGKNSGISSGCQLNAAGGITIGDNVLIGPGTYIWTQNHHFSSSETLIREQGYEYAAVTIGNDVWIAAQCTVLPGLTIADGCVIAAGSVLTRSTSKYTVMAGVPAKQIGTRGNINTPPQQNASTTAVE